MVKFILTLEDIPKELYRNYKSYYDYYHKIPINCSNLLYLMPYYKNMKQSGITLSPMLLEMIRVVEK